MPSFTVPCPSCENKVSIKDPKLIGTKTECPKCKYRFKVEEPADGANDPGKAAKGQKPVAAEDSAKKKKKNKKLVAIGAAVLAVGVLVVVGVSMMGDKKPTPGPKPGGAGKQFVNATTPGATPAITPTPKDTPDNEPEKKGPTLPVAPTPPKKAIARSDKQTTDLFPNATVSLLRFDYEKFRHNFQPVNPLFDPTVVGMFRTSFGIDADNVGVYYHAVVGPTHDPFGLIKLREPVAEKEVVARMSLVDDPKRIRGRLLYTFKANPFIDAVADSFSLVSLLGDAFVRMPPAPAPVSTPSTRVIGVCVYDSQHILVGDVAQIETFLTELDLKGYPKFRSTLTPPKEGSDLQLAEKDMYMSVDPQLKKMLKSLDSETESPPAVLYAEKHTQGIYEPKLLKREYRAVGGVLDPLLRNTVYLGANCPRFTPTELAATVKLWLVSEGKALEVVKTDLAPVMPLATMGLSLFLQTPVQYRPGKGIPDAGLPGDPGTGQPGFPGQPGMPPSQPGMPYRPGMPGSGMGPPGRPGQPGQPGGPMPSGPGMPNRPPGMSGQPPKGPGMPYGPSMPGMTGQPGATPDPKLARPSSFVDMSLSDNDITIAVSLKWTPETNREVVTPRLAKYLNGLKGMIAVHASDVPFHGLSAAVTKMVAEKGAFPRGTSKRQVTDPDRRGFQYPPATRVSFFAELLPYVNRGGYSNVFINHELAWYDPVNLTAAETWVPEFLAPSYSQAAWRATSPYVPDGRSLGGTNYVAIAGVGVNAARYSPAEYPRKVGIVGYEWGSEVKDVADGLSNTIFLMQTPPGVQQPWLAGGGATIRGLDEADPMRGFRINGQAGTYALMGDGSVRFIKNNISPEVLKAMATRAGGETLADLEGESPRIDKPAAAVKAEPAAAKAETKPVAPMPPETKPGPKPEIKATDPKKSSDAPPAKKEPPPSPKEPVPGTKLELAPEPRVKG